MKFKVVLIDKGQLFAQKLEEALNDLASNGFEVQIDHFPKGTLLVGVRNSYSPVNSAGTETNDADRVEEQFLRKLFGRLPPPELLDPEHDIPPALVALCRQTPTPLLRDVISWTAAIEQEHRQQCAHTTCLFSAMLSVISDELTNYLQTIV